MAKKKTLTLAKVVEKAAVLLQLLVRLEASDDNGYVSCVTCDVKRHYKDGMQGGHYMSRGNSATKLMTENIHPQCSGCNGFGMKYGDKEKVYLRYMEDMYGKEFVQELEASKHQTKKWNRAELMDLIADLRERVRVEEERVIG